MDDWSSGHQSLPIMVRRKNFPKAFFSLEPSLKVYIRELKKFSPKSGVVVIV